MYLRYFLIISFLFPHCCLSTNFPDFSAQYYTPLMKAVDAQDLVKVKKLIRQGANVNAAAGGYPGTTGTTALMIASYRANIPIMRELIKAGANYNEVAWADQPHAGQPVLWYAMQSNSASAVELLINAGANPNTIIEWGKSENNITNVRNHRLLTYAIGTGLPSTIIDVLIKYADINMPDLLYNGWTPLMVATYINDFATVQKLVRAGARINMKNVVDNNKTALDYAQNQGYTDIVLYLQKNKGKKATTTGKYKT